MIKPLSKPESPKIISNQPKNLNKPTIVESTQSKSNLQNQDLKKKPSQNLNQDKKTIRNNTNPSINSPARPPIQLIEKPKNLTNLNSRELKPNNYNSRDKRQILNKNNQIT